MTDALGNEARFETLEFETDPLPDIFPTIELAVAEPSRMEPGITPFDTFRWLESGPVSDYGLLVAVDDAGEVVWFYEANHGVGDALKLSNGHLLYQSERKGRAYVRMVALLTHEVIAKRKRWGVLFSDIDFQE